MGNLDEDLALKQLRHAHHVALQRLDKAAKNADKALVGGPERRELVDAELAAEEAGRRVARRVEELNGMYRCPAGHELVNWAGGRCVDAEGRPHVRVMACPGCGGLYALLADGSQVRVEPVDPDWDWD